MTGLCINDRLGGLTYDRHPIPDTRFSYGQKVMLINMTNVGPDAKEPREWMATMMSTLEKK